MALYTYGSPESGDLTFREGDIILVSQREGDWWRGCTGDRAGLFPSNYVKPKEAEVRTRDTHTQDTHTGHTHDLTRHAENCRHAYSCAKTCM